MYEDSYKLALRFGIYPPDPKGEGDIYKVEKRWRTCGLFALAVIFGIGFLYISTLLEEGFGKYFSESIAIALFTSVIVGLTLELSLRLQIIEDVFRSSIGYLLPDYLKDSLNWIYSLPLCAKVCQHDITIKIHPQNLNKVLLKQKSKREIHNISDKNQTIPLGVGVQEWFHPEGNSKIISLSYSIGRNGEQQQILLQDVKPSNDDDRDFMLSAQAIKEVILRPKEFITITWETEEIEWKNGETFIAFSTVTEKPTINIDAPDEFGTRLRFYNGSQSEFTQTGNSYKFWGTLLPDQIIHLRWWDKKDSEVWKKGFQ